MKETLSRYQVHIYAKYLPHFSVSLGLTWSSKLRNVLVNGRMCSPLEMDSFHFRRIAMDIQEQGSCLITDTSTSF